MSTPDSAGIEAAAEATAGEMDAEVPCRCIDAYKGRGLVDPQCSSHDLDPEAIATAAITAYLAAVPEPEAPSECSGIAATWCDVHGECTCPSYGPDDGTHGCDGRPWGGVMGTGPDPQAIAPDDRADIIEWIVDGLDNRGYEADVSAAGDVFTVTVALNETGPTLEGQGRSRKLNGVTQSPSSVSPAAAPSPAGEPADYGWPDGVRSDVHGILQGGDGSDEAHDYATDKADEILRYFARTDLASPAGEAEPRECSGIAATWCDVHGECTCPSFGPDDPERTMDGYTCPLHSFTSEHPIEPAAAVSPVPGEPDETAADEQVPRFVQGPIRRFVRAGRGEPWVEVDADDIPVPSVAPVEGDQP